MERVVLPLQAMLFAVVVLGSVILRQLRAAAARGQLVHLDCTLPDDSDADAVVQLPGALACLVGLQSLRLKIDVGDCFDDDGHERGVESTHAALLAANLAPALRCMNRLTRLELLSIPMAALAQALAAPADASLLRSLKVAYAPPAAFETRLAPALLQRRLSLTSLSLVQCSISGPSAEAALAAVLGHMPGLLHLNIGNAKDGEKITTAIDHDWNNILRDSVGLAAALRGLPDLVSLEMDGCGCEIGDSEVLAALANLTRLQVLNMSSNELGDVPVVARMTNLRDLRMDWCDITDVGALKLALVLPDLGRLERLDIYNNEIGAGGAAVVVFAAAKHATMKILRVLTMDPPLTMEAIDILKGSIAGSNCALE